jgi:hypothetical protein
LRAFEPCPVPEEADVHARGMEPLLAEGAGAVGIGERHDDDLTAFDFPDVAADLLDHADCLVAHTLAGHVRPAVVRP